MLAFQTARHAAGSACVMCTQLLSSLFSSGYYHGTTGYYLSLFHDLFKLHSSKCLPVLPGSVTDASADIREHQSGFTEKG